MLGYLETNHPDRVLIFKAWNTLLNGCVLVRMMKVNDVRERVGGLNFTPQARVPTTWLTLTVAKLRVLHTLLDKLWIPHHFLRGF